MASYHAHAVLIYGSTPATATNVAVTTVDWTNAVGGYGSTVDNGQLDVEDFWPLVAWPQWTSAPWESAGLVEWEEDGIGNVWNISTNGGELYPVTLGEHCAVNWNYPLVEWGWQQRTADAEYKLATGGPQGSKQQNLWVISATAWAHTNSTDGYGTPVPPQQIQIGSLGNLGADGNLYVVLPDNTNLEVTVKVNGVDDYQYTQPTATKYHPYIGLTTRTTNADLDTNTPEVCVGQLVTLGADWQGGQPHFTNVDGVWWHLPDKYVNQQTNYSSTCSNYVKNTDLLTNLVQQCWYVNLPGGTCSVRETLHFANGQSVNIAAAGSFTVYRPQITGLIVSGNPFVGFTTNDGIFIGVSDGYGSTRHEMEWDLYVDLDLVGYHGALSYLQLINHNDYYDYNGLPIHHSTSGQYWLDNSTVFGDSHQINASDMMSADLNYGDAPGIEIAANSYVQDTENFLTYVQFQPDGGIAVTIGVVDWGWIGNAQKSGGTWSQVTGTVTGPHVDYSNDALPQWTNVWNTGMNH